MAGTYDHREIEAKWQKVWEATKAYQAPRRPNPSKKLYVLDMFPYPSGAGLHVGHVEGYTATDIYTRFKRMQGCDVLHPMGWDAFGLPAENYAIKTGIPPATTTNEAIDTFRKQIKSLGLSYDWSREIGAHTPEYYRWTQWFFLFLYKHGLAEKKLAKVNWCPQDQTVLANEQVVDGACERCGSLVVQKDLEQWFFTITKFADALHDDLDQVDWPESTKINQRNWIGRSEGAEIVFPVRHRTSDAGQKIKVFTTRPDTLFGATYVVLAPEHPILEALKDKIENWNETLPYMEAARNKTELERQESRDKTGVLVTGITAVNPATEEEIPIYVADYVLGGYGTGAIMAVPAHDERDYEFAQKFGIPIKQVVTSPDYTKLPYVGCGTLINSGHFDGLESSEAKQHITKQVGGRMVKIYRLRDWLISRQRYWGAPIPVVYDPAGKPHPVPEEHLPWMLPTDVEFKPTGTSPLGQSKELIERTERLFGKGWRPEVDTMDTFVCSSWYFLRFADPHNHTEFASKEAVANWLPVDLYVGGAEHTVLHLLYARFFTKALQAHGYISFGEPFLALRHQGTILAEDGTKMSKSKGNIVNPDSVIAEYGADTMRMYEMFMGPFEAMKPWTTRNILGIKRFLEKVWRLQPTDAPATLMDPTVKKVTDDIESLKFNTAISALMIAFKELEDAGAPKASYAVFLQLLHPFAPHLTSELAHKHGVELNSWPVADPKKLVVERVTVAVQVNGKVRGSIELVAGEAEDQVLAKARAAVGKWLEGKEETKALYVPGKVVNFVL